MTNKIDITKMSRAEIEKRLGLVKELKRRKREARTSYIPNKGQNLVHSSTKLIRAVFSGNGSGKTACATHEAIWAALGYNPILKKTTPVPAKVIYVFDTPDKVQDVFIPEVHKWFDTTSWVFSKKGRHHVTEILLPNGSEIQFMSHQQEALKFESIELDMAIFDEPPPRHLYIGLLRGGRKKGRQARYLLVGTPISGAWMNTEIYQPWVNGDRDDIDCFTYGTTVNEKNLSDGYMEQYGRSLTEKEKRVRFHGEFFNIDGLALGHLFDRDLHIVTKESVPEIVLAAVAIDPHAAKNHTACVLGVDKGGRFYYLAEISSKSTPREFSRELKKMYQPYPIFDIICDSLGASPLSGGDGNKSFIDVLNEEGVRARATSFHDKSEETWIMKIQEVLTLPPEPDNFGQRVPLLRVVEGNAGIIKDIETVSWTKIRNEDAYKPKLDIRNKDYLACLKYALATNLSPIKRKSARGYVRKEMPTTYGKLRRRFKRIKL